MWYFTYTCNYLQKSVHSVESEENVHVQLFCSDQEKCLSDSLKLSEMLQYSVIWMAYIFPNMTTHAIYTWLHSMTLKLHKIVFQNSNDSKL